MPYHATSAVDRAREQEESRDVQYVRQSGAASKQRCTVKDYYLYALGVQNGELNIIRYAGLDHERNQKPQVDLDL